jgi:hypothetical protein
MPRPLARRRPAPAAAAAPFALLALLALSAPRSSAAPPPGEGRPPLPPPREVPGINAPDRFPLACVACHLDYKDLGLDVRLSTQLRRWCDGADPRLLAAAQDAAPAGLLLTGRHPDAAEALADIPDACLACHGEDAVDAPPFARLMHRLHLEPRPDNAFLAMFQGECTHCHKLDVASGVWRVPSGPER